MKNHYTENYNNRLFLTNINFQTAIDMIKKKPEGEIKQIIDFTHKEINNLPAKYDIDRTDNLPCEVKEGIKLTPREEEFFVLVKSGYSIEEISKKLMCCQNVVKTNIKIFITKLLIGCKKTSSSGIFDRQFRNFGTDKFRNFK